MVLLKLNQTFRGSFVSFISIDMMTVTEIKDFMLSLVDNYDIELYNKDNNTGKDVSSALVIE